MVYDVIVSKFEELEDKGYNVIENIEETLKVLGLKNNAHKRKFVVEVYNKYTGKPYKPYLDTRLLLPGSRKVDYFEAYETARFKFKKDENFNLNPKEMAKYLCKKLGFKHTEANFYLFENIYYKALGLEYDENIERFLK